MLGATLFLPRGAKRHAVLINSATAVPRKIYRGFAGYLARRGCAVLTYDYRGIGDSRQKSLVGYNQPKSLVGFKASMSDWAALDVTAAVAWMRERYNNLPLSYVGHSFGGQALGLLANNSEVSRALLIAAQAGYWKLMASPERYRVYAMLNFVGTPLTRLLGYAPGWSGIGEDLPKGVFQQWVGWVMSERYLFDDPKLPALPNFANYQGAMRALCLSDDPWATRPAVELLCSGFTAIKPEILTIDARRCRRRQDRPFRLLPPRASRHAVARVRRNGCEANRRCIVDSISSRAQTQLQIVIARSEATKQSISLRERMDCFASLAMTVICKFERNFPFSRRDAPELVHEIFRPKEGVGNAGCPLHPQPRACSVESTRVSHHGHTGITRHSRTQWF